MREIKFSYIQQHEDTESISDSRLTLQQIEELTTGGVTYKNYTLVARRQFTGLLDKNGKEIYEGDVVSITNPLCQIQKARLIGVVVFSWAAFHVDIKRAVQWESYDVDPPDFTLLANIANSKEIAVIGNIHETPELLTK